MVNRGGGKGAAQLVRVGRACKGAQGPGAEAGEGRAGVLQKTRQAAPHVQRTCAERGGPRRRRTGHAPTWASVRRRGGGAHPRPRPTSLGPAPARLAPRPSHPGPFPLWAPPPNLGSAPPLRLPAALPPRPGACGPREPYVRPRPQTSAPPPRHGLSRASRAYSALRVPALAAPVGRRFGQRGECLGCLSPAKVRGSPWGEQASGALGAVQPPVVF